MGDNKKLYDNLLKSGKVTANELGDFNTFDSLLQDNTNAVKLYNNLRKNDLFTANEIGDENTFMSLVQSSPTQEVTPVNGKQVTEEPIVEEKNKLSFVPQKNEVKNYMALFNKTPQQKTAEATDTSVEFVKQVEEAATKAETPTQKKYENYRKAKIFSGFKEKFPEYGREIDNIVNASASRNPTLQMQAASDFERIRSSVVNDPRYVDYNNQYVSDTVDAATESLLDDTKKIKEVVEKSTRGNWIQNIGYGFGKGVEEYFKGYTDLLTNINKDQRVKALNDKWEKITKGENVELTENEKLLTKALYDNFQQHKKLDPLIPTSYNLGKGAGMSAGFMAEFIATGAIARGVTTAGKTFLTAGRIGGALKPIELATLKLVETGIKTWEMPSLYLKAAQKVADGQSTGMALVNSWNETYPEILTEYMFMGGSGKAAKGIMNKIFERAGITFRTDSGVLGWIKNQAEEYAEEKMGEIYNAPKDHDSFKDFWKSFTNAKENLTTLGTVILLGGGMTAPSLIGSSISKARSEIKMNGLKKRLPEALRSDIDLIVGNQDLTNNEILKLIFESVDARIDDGTISSNYNKVSGDAVSYAIETLKNKVSQTVNKAKPEELFEKPKKEKAPKAQPKIEGKDEYSINGIRIEYASVVKTAIENADNLERINEIKVKKDDAELLALKEEKTKILTEEKRLIDKWKEDFEQAGDNQELKDKANADFERGMKQLRGEEVEAETPVETPAEEVIPESVAEKPVEEAVPETLIEQKVAEPVSEFKNKQLDIINKSNPMLDEIHTGIRSVDDIKTAQEAFQESIDNNENPTEDFTVNDIQNSLKAGKITVYSSYPIENGVFVTPSKMQAKSYSGTGKVYSKEVLLDDVAWIDSFEGQYAKVETVKEEKEEKLPEKKTEISELQPVEKQPVPKSEQKKATVKEKKENIRSEFGKLAYDILKKYIDRVGDELIDYDRLINTTKNILKVNPEEKSAAFAEALHYEMGYPDNWQDLRDAINKGGFERNRQAVERMIEVGVSLPLDISDLAKKEKQSAEKPKKEKQSAEKPGKGEPKLQAEQIIYPSFAKALGLTKTSLVSSLGNTARNGKINGVNVVIQQGDNANEAIKESIRTPWLFRGRGKATNALRKLTAEADRMGITLKLRAVPEKGAKISQENLQRWYEKNGFVFAEGSNKGVRSPNIKLQAEQVKPIIEEETKYEVKINGEWYSKSSINVDENKVGDFVPELMKYPFEKVGETGYYNPNYFTEQQWNLINKELTRMGFEKRPTQDWKTFFNNKKNKRVSDEHLIAFDKVFGKEKVVKSTSQKIITKAKRYFGLTSNFKEVGYLTPDGDMLDFSGKKFGGERNTRAMDHREINSIDTDMREFTSMGNIRMHPESGSIELTVIPTREQVKTLLRYFQYFNGDSYVDFVNPETNHVEHYVEYNKTKASKIIGDIINYYQNGIKPISSVKYHIRPEVKGKERLAPVPQKVFDTILAKLFGTKLAKAIITDKAKMIEKLNQYGIKKLEDLKRQAELKLMATTSGEVYGFITPEGEVYIDPDKININTPIHEYGHLWINWAKTQAKNLFDKGMELADDKTNPYFQKIWNNPAYATQRQQYEAGNKEAFLEEVLATAIGDKGEQFVNAKQKSDFKQWLKDLFESIKQALGISQYSAEQLQDITFDEFSKAVAVELLKGEQIIKERREQNAEEIRAGVETPGKEKGIVEAEGERIRVRDTFKDREAKTGEEVTLQAEEEPTNKIKQVLDDFVASGALNRIDRNSMLSKIVANIISQTQVKTQKETQDDAFNLLYELIKEKGTLAGQRASNKEFKALRDLINKLLKTLTSKERTFITHGQLNSIRNRALAATTPKARQKVLDYINDTVIWNKGAKLKMRFAEAEELKNKIAKRNKGEKSDFGSARVVADRVENIDLEQLSYEELQDFINIARKIFRTKEPNVFYLNTLATLFGRKQKQFEEKIDKIQSLDDLLEYLNGIIEKKSLIDEDEMLDEETGKLVYDIDSYVYWQRKLNYVRRKLDKLMDGIDDINDDILKKKEQIENQIGKIDAEETGKYGTIQQELIEFRKILDNQIILKLLSQNVTDAIELFEGENVKANLRLLLSYKLEDIKSLSLADILTFDTALDNLIQGELTTGLGHIQNLLSQIHEVNLSTEKAINEINKSPLWKNWKKRKFQTMTQWLAGKVSPFKWHFERDEEFQLKHLFSTRQGFSVGTIFGNFDLARNIGRGSTNLGQSVSRAESFHQNIMDALYVEHDKLKNSAIKNWKKETKENNAYRWRNIIGMFMVERRWQESDKFKNNFKDFSSFLHDIYVNRIGITRQNTTSPSQLDRKELLYKEFFNNMKSNGATKVIDGIEIIDIEKAEEILRQDKGISDMIDAMEDSFEKTKDMVLWSAIINEVTVEFKPNYFPMFALNKANEININSIQNQMERVAQGMRMRAGSTYEWTEKIMEVETDIMNVMDKFAQELGRNFYVVPTLKTFSGAFDIATKKVVKENKLKTGGEEKGDDNGIAMFGRALKDDLLNRIHSNYGAGKYSLGSWGAANRIVHWMTRGVSRVMLGVAAKFGAEFVVNEEKIMFALGKIPVDESKRTMKYYDTWKYIIQDYIPSNMMYKLSEDINSTRYKRKAKRTAEEIGTFFIVTADKIGGWQIFSHYFIQTFEKETGKKFSEEDFMNDPYYRVRYRDAVDLASTVASRRLQELLNNKTPLSQSQRVTLLNGLITGQRDNPFLVPFTFLQGYNKNETRQMVDSYRRARFSPELRAMAIRDMFAVASSNYLYIALRLYLGALQAKLISAGIGYLFGFGGGDDDDETREFRKNNPKFANAPVGQIKDLIYIQKSNDKLKSGEYWIDNAVMRTIPDLALGASANFLEYMGTIALMVTKNARGLEDDTKEEIFKIYDFRRIDRIPEYGSAEYIAQKSLPPMLQTSVKDFFSLTSSMRDTFTGQTFSDILDAIVEMEVKGNMTEKEVYDLINLINITLKYSASAYLISVPIIEQRINQVLPRMRQQYEKELKKKQKESEVNTARSSVGLR